MSELKYDVVKFVDEEFELSVNVSPKEETVWLSLDEMSALFERDRSVIGKHIRKIYQEGELDKNRTWAKNARHLEDGRIFQVDAYNLDVIIAVGYRVNSKRGTLFRQWANKVLKEYLLTGYVINKERSIISKYIKISFQKVTLCMIQFVHFLHILQITGGNIILTTKIWI